MDAQFIMFGIFIVLPILAAGIFTIYNTGKAIYLIANDSPVEKVWADRGVKFSVTVVVSIAVIWIIWLSNKYQPTSSPAKTQTERGESSMAFIQCKDFVKDNLKAPSTADLPFLDYQATKVADNHYIIKSHVDAQNSFGATLRNTFFCDVEWNGIESADRKNWKLISLRFSD